VIEEDSERRLILSPIEVLPERKRCTPVLLELRALVAHRPKAETSAYEEARTFCFGQGQALKMRCYHCIFKQSLARCRKLRIAVLI
jgi:hypothetical protein